MPSTNIQQTVETEPVASGSGFQLPGWGYNNPPPPNNPTEPVASGSGFMLPGWEYNPPPPNTPNRDRQNALSTRNNLFQPYTPPGGLQMFVQAERGNCQFLKRCVQPLLSGSQLQTLQHTKVYVAPLQDETIPITNAQQASYNVECLECGTTVDALELAAHHSICNDRLNELGLLNPEGLRLLSELSHQQMNATEEDAMGDENRRNSDFLAKLSYPLMVTFIDEPGVDCGALRSEFLWSFMDESATASEDADSGPDKGKMTALSKKNLGQRLFTFGLFCGITIIQIGPLGSFFLSALKRVSGAGQDHPFLRDLNIQKVADMLAQYKSVRSLFGDKTLTSEDFLKCVSFDPLHEELATSMLQLSCQNHFETFIKNVESGTVEFPTKESMEKLLMESICNGGPFSMA
ncbi:hypothetical protein DAPPUDRAFT_118023 [Daphnia pulex]|uniref:HECT domain-containing protein n=1 Tax=Daphnia pulex TaxID=6669 RepID=E9HUG9_DAPPU|nr:hypothetical protein DAPPUDRAFT_118023 [Daphnia pulex]|eukprot:EFX64601.1 hypothetical protein DAPPUDRAFT_118023 [Daphnia pulex]